MDTKAARKEEKGQARIQQLMEMFPEMSRQQVLMADYMREGIRHTEVLDEVGRWAWPDPHGHYEYDYEEHKEGDLVEGVSRTPKHIYFEKRGFYLMLDSHSPYEVKYEGGGRYRLYRDGEPIDEVYFVACPQWFWKKTSTGKPMNLCVHVPGERNFSVYVIAYCEYFKDDNQCRFCNMNPTVEHFNKMRKDWGPTKREQEVYETYLAYAQETGVDNITLLGGSFYNRSKEADLFIRNAEILKRARVDSGIGPETIHIVSQAMDEEDQLRLKEAGITSVCWNLEVWDPKLFEVICPGKSSNVGRERWIELLLKGVENFGWGKVLTNFVVGVEMAPPFASKTEDEEAESVAEGMRFMASQGISLVITLMRSNPGSNLARAPRPRTEHYLRMERERSKLMAEYNLASRTRR